ncbi:MAG: putative ABC transport system ATP-binding protein [Saprospiraceae bacterium]|jgi:putative ABC transport system ATP-binding protein
MARSSRKISSGSIYDITSPLVNPRGFGYAKYRIKNWIAVLYTLQTPRVLVLSIYKKKKMIQLKNIEKYYRSGLQKSWVLKDISLDVQPGEFITIMGDSGAGKSTLLQIIGMLDDSNAGEYHFFDEQVHTFKEKKRTTLYKHYIGFVFQAYHLIDDLTVYENIETPLIYRGVKSKERKPMVAELLDRFNIVAKKDLFPEQLSGGQQQLVGLARAIIGKPKLLLADEPTGNLHTKQGDEIMRLFKELHQDGMTIIQVTHSEKNANCGDRIIYLEDGFVKEDKQVKTMDFLRS